MLRFLRNYKAIWFHKQLSICFSTAGEKFPWRCSKRRASVKQHRNLIKLKSRFHFELQVVAFIRSGMNCVKSPLKVKSFSMSVNFSDSRGTQSLIFSCRFDNGSPSSPNLETETPRHTSMRVECAVVKETFRRRLKNNFTWWWTSLRALASRDASYFMLRANLPLNKRNINLRSLNVARRYLSSRNKCNVREISISTSLGVNVFIHQNVGNSCRALKLNNESKSLARNSVEGLMKPLEHIMSCEIWNYGELRLEERIKGILGNEVNLRAGLRF